MLVNGQVEKFGPTREIFAQAQQQAQAQQEQQKKEAVSAVTASPAVVSMVDKPRA
jgi:ABC-type protease/lipase transport system fused ATPase/permease subunit